MVKTHMRKRVQILYQRIFFFMVLLFIFPDTIHAQWVSSGSNIYNTNTGNVGIGTTSPGAKLQVNKTDNSLGEAIKIYKGSDADQAWMTWSQGGEASGSWRMGYSGFPYDLRLSVGSSSSIGTEVMRWTATGNVGIGTPIPGSTSGGDSGAKLELFGSAGSPTALRWFTCNNSSGYCGWAAKAYIDTPSGSWGTAPLIFTTPDTSGNALPTLSLIMGKVGIGTMSPNGKLEVSAINGSLGVGAALSSGQATGFQFLNYGVQHAGLRWSSDNSGNLVLEDASGSANPTSWYGNQIVNFIVRNGSLGIGTTAPEGRLAIDSGSGAFGPTPTISVSGKYEGSLYANGGIRANGFQQNGPYGGGVTLQRKWYNGTNYINEDVLNVTGAGNVGVGTSTPSTKFHVVGDVTVTGNIAAKYQDVAEWVLASRKIADGTVVVLDEGHSNQVMPSSQAYDTRVAGVITSKPGLLLGEGGKGKVKVATTGRVKVKVDASQKPIKVGDLLVTSDKEGIAMKSEPLDLGGVPIHRPGTLIGKALEPLKAGEGEILVLLSLQ